MHVILPWLFTLNVMSFSQLQISVAKLHSNPNIQRSQIVELFGPPPLIRVEPYPTKPINFKNIYSETRDFLHSIFLNSRIHVSCKKKKNLTCK